ncbi:hypothetical protein FTO74_03830 [Granulicella sp. WH15]|uniref:hypothetical protein n=1 Tax=Granulicella sp. WH15 TaxID=2602070 RepID=UPI0013674F4D|nr:hypothetical protein [Granulicella sp. WH15]QHN02597.1 hypothetical protein FTO74_03830 [Granulicella sp. WH15]
MIKITALALATLAPTTLYAQHEAHNVAPGVRTQVLAHNAYPDHGKYEDRLDRALASGMPLAIEEDLAWLDGRSVVIHGAKNASAQDPTLESYLFPKVRPLMEKAMQSGDKSKWPLITLYLDIKNNPPEHLEAIAKVLDRYNSWLTTAVKTDDLTKQSPLKLGPMMILVEDKQNDIKQQFFYDQVPVGGQIRVFGSVTKPAENPTHIPKQEYIDSLVTVPMEKITMQKADNYHRWWGLDWAYVEEGGEEHHREWGKEQETRLKQIVSYGHQLGYLMSFYCLDGFTSESNQGWESEYNFGSVQEVMPRWKSAIHAHADMISTDQFELLAKEIKSR